MIDLIPHGAVQYGQVLYVHNFHSESCAASRRIRSVADSIIRASSDVPLIFNRETVLGREYPANSTAAFCMHRCALLLLLQLGGGVAWEYETRQLPAMTYAHSHSHRPAVVCRHVD
jgi:hypothetical protein